MGKHSGGKNTSKRDGRSNTLSRSQVLLDKGITTVAEFNEFCFASIEEFRNGELSKEALDAIARQGQNVLKAAQLNYKYGAPSEVSKLKLPLAVRTATENT